MDFGYFCSVIKKVKNLCYICCPKLTRKRLIDYLVDNNLINKEVHCLGYDDPNEFSYYIKKGYKFIRSCDSASAILCGMKDIKFSKDGLNVVKPSGGDIYHVSKMLKKQVDLSLHNINVTKKLCGSE